MIAQSLLGYVFVSGVCLILSNVLLIFGDRIGYSLWVSFPIAFAIVLITGYLLHSWISFRRPLGVAAFGRYTVAMTVNIPLMFATIWVWRNVIGLPMSIAAPVATGCMVLINFLLCRWAVLRRREEMRLSDTR